MESAVADTPITERQKFWRDHVLAAAAFDGTIVEYAEANNLKTANDKHWYDGGRCWSPFAYTSGLFVLAFMGLAYSFFPYVVPESLTIWEAAG